ncbi:MAG: NAD-binding protein [Deltaproteobacteria bacterium]|nr:NAD-binding protein [Deltaproteobacteria bacterium]
MTAVRRGNVIPRLEQAPVDVRSEQAPAAKPAAVADLEHMARSARRIAGPAGRAIASDVKGRKLLDLRAQASPFEKGRSYTVGARELSGTKLEAMRQDWLLLVLKRQMPAAAFRKKHGIDKATSNALRRMWPEDFKGRVPSERTFSPSVLRDAKRAIARYHEEELTYLELRLELDALGIRGIDHGTVEKALGITIARRATTQYAEKRRAHFGAIADAITGLIAKHGWVIRKQTDLLQLLSADKGFKERFPPQTKNGSYTLGWLNKLRVYDKKEGEGRVDRLFEAVKPEGKRGRLQPNGVTGAVSQATASSPREGMSVRDQLKTLATMLRGKAPSEDALKKALLQFEKLHGIKRPFRLWRLQMERHKGVITEFQRWRIGSKNDYTLRYQARWVLAMKEAGPGASVEEVEAAFKKSAEFKEDGRLPDAQLYHKIKKDGVGWDLSPTERAKWQVCRNLLETIRTAPKDRDFKQIVAGMKRAPIVNYDKALYYLQLMLKDGLFNDSLDARTLKALKNRTSRVLTGLGEAVDPKFDANTEPPWSPLKAAEKVLAIPRVEDAPLFAHAIKRLDGRLPLEHANMMMVYHRYSDVATLMDLFARAGMSPKNACFVSTPYPFDPAFDLALDEIGVKQEKFPVYDLDGFSSAVERGIERMIKQFDERVKKHGQGQPIIILDDGGQAAKLIETKFKAHAHKFKVVEVTAAGYRITAEMKEKNHRVPFVYYSVAYSEAKKEVASEFYATRVVDRLRKFSEVTGVQAPNKKVAIVGAGAMGRFAALYMKKQGYDVTIVERDPEVRKRMQGLGFTKIYTDAQMTTALKGCGTVLSMAGYKKIIGKEHLDAMMDGALVLQGSSKRNDFDMEAFEKAARKKTLIPRTDDIPQRSYTYEFKDKKRLHFVGDGWTINHDGSLHGSPFEDVQLETALLFESVVEAAGDSTTKTGEMRVVGKDVQEEYLGLWRKSARSRRA